MKAMTRGLALLLVLVMLIGIMACGKPAVQKSEQPGSNAANTESLDRADKELIADLIGGQDASDLSDAELDNLVNDLVGEESTQGGVINLNASEKSQLPSVDVTEHPDVYDENGAMTKPFDQVYPELIKKEQVTFSGQSILVKLASNTLTEGLKAAGIGALEEIVPLEGAAWYEALLIDGFTAESALESVRKLEEVLLAEFNYEVKTAALDDYKHFDKEKDDEFKKNGHNKDQWHFHHCGIVEGYEEMATLGGSSNVVVAVIDSGVDYMHEDLKDNMWVNTAEIPDNNIDDDKNGYIDDYYGVDIISGNGNGGDTNGHGTHVAGIIAARNNNVGVLGIAYNVKIMSVKAAAHNGTLNQADIAKAVLYAYENGAQVINMSFGGTACSIAVQDALATAYTRCVLVASAGNSGVNNEPTDINPIAVPNYPAALTYVLGVMSVDETGKESVFSNWDVIPFNGVEYELYAPGENIMSTLPDNKYGYLSGTSMAAPVVSAFAAILRSEYADPDMYPTKFIYGQLASTSEIHADCVNSEAHAVFGKPHNLPQVADLHAALTKLPKPEVNMQDYALFDDPALSPKNNGDGVIDAGETIALGLTLRNRWGMSENTMVTLDTIAANSGMADPYVTIHNPTVNYGSVGTYSTQDCGKIYTDELFTGWENPFLITISENCPNDYRFTLNVTITCENALDEADTAVYRTQGEVNENVRAGFVLPTVIDEDMVLTKDNLYIIPSATIIQEGVTVRVMPGTHIQFWSDDADDPYADSYIAYLLVNGRFLVEGTKEEPVYIYPSELMNQYNIEIGASSKGYISLKYADITNLMYSSNSNSGTLNKINIADHCTFRNNYAGSLSQRVLSDGVVADAILWNGTVAEMDKATNCVFYKLGFEYTLSVSGNFDRCVFNQCGLNLSMGNYQNCVFLGNSLHEQTHTEKYYNSSLAVGFLPLPDETDIENGCFRIWYRPETGTTYVYLARHDMQPYFAAYIQAVFGGDYVKIETQSENKWIQQNMSDLYFSANISWNALQNCYVWNDGTPLNLNLFPNASEYKNGPYYTNNNHIICNGELIISETTACSVFEIPGYVLPEDITFAAYTVDLDLLTVYQLSPRNTPVQLSADQFLYESTDETVITVNSTGLVTPVGVGSADVWVWSLDRAVRNRVTITVKDYVPLGGLSLSSSSSLLAVGENLVLGCEMTPENTTRKNVLYTSSDTSVATVSNSGIVTGISSGRVTITATCEGFTDTVELTVYQKATSLQLSDLVLRVALDNESLDLPQVLTDTGAETDIFWRSTDESVAALENGNVIPKNLGTTSLVVTDRRSGLSAACLVVVTETAANSVKQIANSDSFHCVLLENGNVYAWNAGNTPVLLTTDVKAMATKNTYCHLLKEHGGIERWTIYRAFEMLETNTMFSDMDITDLEVCQNNNIWVCTSDGSAYAFGTSNNYGQLAIGSTQIATEPTLINLDGVVDIENDGNVTYLLTEQGDLYAAGNLHSITTLTPMLIASNVAEIVKAYDSYYCVYRTTDNKLIRFDNNYGGHFNYSELPYNITGMDQVAFSGAANSLITTQNGKVYTGNSDGTLTLIHGISDAAVISAHNGAYYVGTESGMLLAFGNNPVDGNYMAGTTTDNPVTSPVLIPLQPVAEETITLPDSNLTEGVLTGDTLLLTFPKQLQNANPKLYANGTQITMRLDIRNFNQLAINRTAGFSENMNYELVFAPGTILAAGNVSNEEELRIAFTWEAAAVNTPDAPEDSLADAPIIYESITDSTVQRTLTAESLMAKLLSYKEETQYNPNFNGNVILNPISTDFDVSHWLRIQAPSVAVGTYSELPLGGNYWGTTGDRAIGLQIIDYADYPNFSHLMYAPFLTEAPENTFPFVTDVKLFNKYGEEVTTVGNEEITFRVSFNRDMDTSIPLLVRFGSAYPYGDYEVAGHYVDARTWEGTYTLNTLIENGNHFFTISNGCSATDDLELLTDQFRFGFEIDTTAAQALIMQGTSTNTGIELSWTQDDFKTLMGYNVYRATKEDGYYTRLNATVIPADVMSWFDDTVEPGMVYYYNFTVVQTDLSESTPSGKIVIMSKDTMAPNIYHSQVTHAFTGSNLIVSATITDNLNIAYAKLYYRIAGTETWNIILMNKLNDKYSAIIPAQYVTMDGIEYYIEAFDGVSYTYRASDEKPFTIAVQEALDANAMGDVDGDGVITNLDALLVLYAKNDKVNLTAEQFARADLNGDNDLWAAEALQILRYVSGEIGSLKMDIGA